MFLDARIDTRVLLDDLADPPSPATVFEGILFGFVLYRSFRINFRNLRAGRGVSLYEVIIKDQIRYWVGYVACPSPSLSLPLPSSLTRPISYFIFLITNISLAPLMLDAYPLSRMLPTPS